jgi:hypothetical protein
LAEKLLPKLKVLVSSLFVFAPYRAQNLAAGQTVVIDVSAFPLQFSSQELAKLLRTASSLFLG